jgi:uncharacterized membrane protein
MGIIKHYLKTKKQEALMLSLLTLFCCVLLLIRAKNSQSIFFFFLIWNLFLGGIPYFIAEYLKLSVKFQENKWLRIGTLLVWLLFLPNSFYIITDFFHLNKFQTVPIWYDLIVVSSFAITGFLFGLYSLFTIEKILTLHYSKKISQFLIFIIIYLTAFGIYLGRFLRFNSWDILTNPLQLVFSCCESLFIREVQHFTLGFGTFLLLIYFVASTTFSSNKNF